MRNVQSVQLNAAHNLSRLNFKICTREIAEWKDSRKRSVSAWHPINKNALKLMTTTSVFNCCFKTQPTIKSKTEINNIFTR